MSVKEAEIIPYIFYRDVPAALDWLAGAFGFVEELRHATPRGSIHAEMTLAGRRIMLGSGEEARTPAEAGAPTQGVFVYVDDAAGHHAQAVAAGARIDAPPADHGYGPTYKALDLEGHPWFFTQR